MKHLLAAAGSEETKNMAGLKALMMISGYLYFFKEHKHEFEIFDRNILIEHILECYVSEHLNRAGTTEIHMCAATARLRSWLEASGLEGEVTGSRNTNSCNGSCRIRFNANQGWPLSSNRRTVRRA